jgi:hypothetical protein
LLRRLKLKLGDLGMSFGKQFALKSMTKRSARDPADFGSFERQIVHQACRVEDKANNRTGDGIGVYRSPAPSVTIATDASTPIFNPARRLSLASASSVMNMMMTDRSCTASLLEGITQVAVIAITRQLCGISAAEACWSNVEAA